MKKTVKTLAYIILAAAATSCAKAVTEGPNDANIRYFDAWLKVNHPNAKEEGLGVYVIGGKEGTGAEVKKDGFAYVRYTKTDLEGNISEYTEADTAKKLGTYNETYYYGPKVLTTIDQTIPTGVLDAIVGMKVGGSKKVIIPSWLMTYYVYGTKEEYLANTSNSSNTIYNLEITDFTEDIVKHEDKLVKDYMSKNQDTFGSYIQPRQDTTFYYQCLTGPAADAEAFPSDTTIYINYTGRLLNGLVFDTTYEKVAKDNGLHSESKTYEPVEIHWGEKYTDITMGSGSSSVISGFAMTLWQMKAFEKGIGIFSSPFGYSYNGSGNSIPAYAPLIFEIEIVEKPEE